MRILPILLLLLIPIHAPAQTVEYGEASELRGITKVFIDTAEDTKARERIIKEIAKSKLSLEVLSSPEGAELFISFASETSEQATGVKTRPPLVEGFPARSRIEYDTIEQGKGVAFTLSNNRRRILFSWSGYGNTAKNFASHFIKAYKKANNLK